MFRNGFRILPFGETGDDSWGIDFRAQQGRARYLSSRDLMGRVDIFVEDVSELKKYLVVIVDWWILLCLAKFWNCLNKVKKGLKDMLLVFYGGNPFEK